MSFVFPLNGVALRDGLGCADFACGISDVCERGFELLQSSYALEDLLY